jgi:hypothetical protein
MQLMDMRGQMIPWIPILPERGVRLVRATFWFIKNVKNP